MSRVSSIRSAAQATFSAPRQVPIRWRLAGGSALLTLVILCGFAGAVGGLTSQRLHEDFDREVSDAADLLQARIKYDGLVPGARSTATSSTASRRRWPTTTTARRSCASSCATASCSTARR